MKHLLTFFLLICFAVTAAGHGKCLDRLPMPSNGGDSISVLRAVSAVGYPTDPVEQFKLGSRYYNGDGVAQDYSQAVYWYRKAAEQGDAEAQYNMGVCYENGQGVDKDYAQAVCWYRLAAEQGLADAQFNLGVCYYKGLGTSKDKAQAIYWFEKVAGQGGENAKTALDEVKGQPSSYWNE